MLKINPINGLNHFSVKKSEKQNNNSTNPITTSSNPTEVFTSGVPRSYINFRGKTEDELKFGDDAKQLINRAKNIAIEMGHDEITPFHIISASIQETEDNIKYIQENQPELFASGQISSISTLNKLANNYASRNMLITERDFDYFLDIVDGFKQENDEYLNALPVNKDIKGKGYYTYTKEVNSSTGLISSVKLKNKIYNDKETQKIPWTLSSVGYVSKYGVMNLKMVSIDEMVGINNVFSFSSITPKIQVTNKTQLIDGVVASIVPTGMDTSDLKNEGSEDDPQYYFYVEVWDSIDEVGNLDNKLQVRPRIRVNINDLDNVRIDKLLPNSTYYYKVYAYMYKNGVSTYTELFSSNYLNEYKTETYTFLTLGAEAIFQSYKNEIVMDKNIYGNRSISTNINLIAYKNSESFDYSIFYYMCKTDSEICMRNDTTSEDIVVNNLFENSIPMDELKTSNSREIDISSLNLEFGTDYKMYIYADIDVYDIGEDGEYYIRKHNLLLNGISLTTRLRALTEPSFVVTREAKIVDGEYVIDFKVVVNDPDKTLVNGEYFVKLTEGGNLIGTIQELTEDGYTDISLGSIEDYSKYPFDASVTNKSIRIKGLSEESKYTVTVSGRAYVNNYSSDVPVEDRTFDVVKSHTVYSSNQYGIALGKDLTFSATEKSIIVTFLGGSSFENIKKVHYTIGLYDEEDTNTTSGTYVIGENGKYFEIYNRENWRFVINPDGMQNILGKTYVVALSFEVQLTNMEEPVILTSDLYSGKVEYVIDEKDK